MIERARQLEEAFRELGQRIGRELAARMRESKAERQLSVGAAVETQLDAPPPSTKPRLLPGLSGRRRMPGEAPPPCGRADCDRPSRTRGYCQTHYVQWLKAGDPLSKAS